MTPGFANEFEGQRPHYEVWYGKVDLDEDRALWFRYTIFAGALDEASTWAVLFDRGRIDGGRSYWSLDELAEPNTVVVPEGRKEERFLGNRSVFHAPGEPVAHLDESNAVGGADEIEWDLRWTDSGRRFEYVPKFFETIGVAGTRYDACFLDLRVDGEVSCGDRTLQVEGRPGMLGHIRGSAIAPARWAWSHCNDFVDDDSAVFEGLTVRMPLFGRESPPIAGFVVWVDGREYAFRTLWSIVAAGSEFDREEWRFEASAGGAHLEGRARAPDRSRVALVEYDDTDGSNLWCYNSKLADLTLELDAPELEGTRRLRSEGTASYEFMTREEPAENPLI